MGDGPFRTPSPPVVRPAAPRDLGAQKASYGYDPLRRGYAVMLGALLAVLLAIVGGQLGGGRFAAGGAITGLAIAAVAGLVTRWDRSSVALHERGLVIRSVRGVPRELAFEDVDLVFVSIVTSGFPFGLATGNRIVLTTHAGERIVLPHPPLLGRLVDPLIRECTLPLVPSFREGLAEGHVLKFGPLTIDRQGVTLGIHHRGWSEISRATFDLHRLTFYGTNGRAWQWLGLETIPHGRALALLLERQTRVEHSLPRIYTLFRGR